MEKLVLVVRPAEIFEAGTIAVFVSQGPPLDAPEGVPDRVHPHPFLHRLQVPSSRQNSKEVPAKAAQDEARSTEEIHHGPNNEDADGDKEKHAQPVCCSRQEEERGLPVCGGKKTEEALQAVPPKTLQDNRVEGELPRCLEVPPKSPSGEEVQEGPSGVHKKKRKR